MKNPHIAKIRTLLENQDENMAANIEIELKALEKELEHLANNAEEFGGNWDAAHKPLSTKIDPHEIKW
jgi:hypothetical protein